MYTRLTRKRRMEKAMVVVRAARRAMGMVKRKRKGRIRPYPGPSNAISTDGEEMAFCCARVGEDGDERKPGTFKCMWRSGVRLKSEAPISGISHPGDTSTILSALYKSYTNNTSLLMALHL